MAQLVKLQDYISRYQIDLARYPTQFIRLKKGQWDRVKQQWQTGEVIQQWEHIEDNLDEDEKKPSLFKRLFARKKLEVEQFEEDIENVDPSSEVMDHTAAFIEDDSTLIFEPNLVYQPKTIEELKKMYIDQFFHFQMKWASSTLREKSYVDPKYMRDTLLRSFLQTLPDNYLIFYYPILRLKKAPIELDIIIMTPTECICVTVLEQEEQAVYVGSSERFWMKKVGKLDKKVLNPMIQLSRMETILTKLFAAEQIELPIRKVLLTRNGYIDYPGSAYGVQFVDKRKFPEWMTMMKRTASPMKHMQIRAAQVVLNNVQTTSFQRDMWSAPEQPQEETEK